MSLDDISPTWVGILAIGIGWLAVILIAAGIARTLKPGMMVVPPEEVEDPGTPEYWAEPGPRHPDHGRSP